MTISASAITSPGMAPAMNSLGMDRPANSPCFCTASTGTCRPMAEMPKITMGMDGGMMMPMPPDAAVTAPA